MATKIVMPNLGFDTTEARILEWKIREGDPVEKGQVIAVIETDKAAVELESIAAGILLERFCHEGEMAAVGIPIARVGQKGELTQPTPLPQVTVTASQMIAPSVSPVADRLAREHGIDLAGVSGSGPGGRIMRGDVERLIQSRTQPKPFDRRQVPKALPRVRQAAKKAGIELDQFQGTGPGGTITLADLGIATKPADIPQVTSIAEQRREITIGRMRRAIGKRMSESKRAAPHFYVSGEFDVDAAVKRLGMLTAPAPRINDLLQYLAVQTLIQVPVLNATFEEDHLYQCDSIDLAIVVAVQDGLYTPVLHHAERLTLPAMAEHSRALVQRARQNRLSASDLSGGTFTISNLGIFRQVDQFTAVINPPQVAILAVGAVKPRPVVIDGGLFVRETVQLVLSGDHRVVDGVHLAEFLSTFQKQVDAFAQGLNS